MSLTDILCALPPPPPAGCCGASPKPAAAPLVVLNPPGLSRIQYRVGTFTTFRRAMLNDVARPDLLGAIANPFLAWHEGTDGDYHTLFIELWAYLADVLTFYQELIANEAFLPTAVQRDSLFRLAELLDYRPAPGSGAAGFINFVVEKNKSVVIPAGFRVGSKAQPATEDTPAKAAAVFETETGLLGLAAHSSIPLSPVAPTNQFAQLASFSLFTEISSSAAQFAADIYGNAGAVYLGAFLQQSVLEASTSQVAFSQFSPAAALRISGGSITTGLNGPGELITQAETASNFNLLFPYTPHVNETTRTIILKGITNRLAVGDYVIAVENEGDATLEKGSLRSITSVTTDKAGDVTTIRWSEPVNTIYDRSKSEVVLYALRVKAGAFGNTAPAFNTLPATLTGTVNDVEGPLIGQDWDDDENEYFYLPRPEEPLTQIYLDGIYDDIKAAPEQPGWAALVGEGQDEQVVHVTDARPVSKAAYAITNKVTRLTLRESITAETFPLRTTVVAAGSQPLTLQNNLPLPELVSGDQLILTGIQSQLKVGQSVVVEGILLGTASNPVINAELRTLREILTPDSTNNITTVILDKPLDKQYIRAGTNLLANVLPVTQGETVRDEKLGSGNGSANQTFRLKQKPLTYLPSTDPEGISAVASTLIVTVNGVSWQELRTLLDSPPDAQAYTARQDAAGETTVAFGDGFNAARPPTGRDNIRARYRKGLGASGNVDPGGIQQMVDNIAGLQRVSNPLATGGGAEPESLEQIRRNAPGSVRAFGRAVSVSDYAALALTFPSVVKASAAYTTRNPDLTAIAQPFVQLTIATENRLPLSQQPAFAAGLRSFLDQRRDPNVPLRIVDFVPVFVDVALTVNIDDRFPQQATLAAVRAALNPGANPDSSLGFFAFDRLGFGQSISLSAVYATAQSVPGVTSVNVTTLRRMDLDAGEPLMVRDDIFVRPGEIVVVGDDPNAPEKGALAVNLGVGGFADQ